MDPVHPDIDEVAIGKGAATPLVILGPPGRRQARDRGGREPRGVCSEQHRQRLAEVPRRETMEIEQRQHGAALRRAAQIGRQDLAGEALAHPIDAPSIIHPRRSNRDRPGSYREATRPGRSVADHQRMAAAVTSVPVLPPVLLHFDFQRRQDHTAGSLSGQRIQRRGHLQVTPVRVLLRSDSCHHRRAFPRPASRSVRGMLYPERYVTFSPSFPNF